MIFYSWKILCEMGFFTHRSTKKGAAYSVTPISVSRMSVKLLLVLKLQMLYVDSFLLLNSLLD